MESASRTSTMEVYSSDIGDFVRFSDETIRTEKSNQKSKRNASSKSNQSGDYGMCLIFF